MSEEIRETLINSLLYNERSPLDFRFTKLDGTVLDVISTTFENGEILTVTDTTGTVYEKDEFIYEKDLLPVKGIGYLPQGTIVEYDGKYYILYFGWHKNISNQEIYSWYLVETHSNTNYATVAKPHYECKTLYKNMIDKLNKVKF